MDMGDIAIVITYVRYVGIVVIVYDVDERDFHVYSWQSQKLKKLKILNSQLALKCVRESNCSNIRFSKNRKCLQKFSFLYTTKRMLASPACKQYTNCSARVLNQRQRSKRLHPRTLTIKRCGTVKDPTTPAIESKNDKRAELPENGSQFEKGETRDNKRIEFILLGLKDLQDWENKVTKIKDDFSPRNVAMAVRMLDKLSQNGKGNHIQISSRQSYLLDELLQQVQSNIQDYTPDGVSFLVLSLARIGYAHQNKQLWTELGNSIIAYGNENELDKQVLCRITSGLHLLPLDCQIFKTGKFLNSIEMFAARLLEQSTADNQSIRLISNLVRITDKFNRDIQYLKTSLSNVSQENLSTLEPQDLKNLVTSLKNLHQGGLSTLQLLTSIEFALDNWFENNQESIVQLYCGDSTTSNKSVIDWMSCVELLVSDYDHEILNQLLSKLFNLCASQPKTKFALPKIALNLFMNSWDERRGWSEDVLKFSFINISKLRVLRAEVRVEVLQCVNKALSLGLLTAEDLADEIQIVEGEMGSSELTYKTGTLKQFCARLIVRLVTEMEKAAQNKDFVRQHTGNLADQIKLLKEVPYLAKDRIVSIYNSLLNTLCEFGKENMFSALSELYRKGFPPNKNVIQQLMVVLEVCSLRDCVQILDLCQGWRLPADNQLFVQAYNLAQRLMTSGATDVKGASALLAYLFFEGIQDEEMISTATKRIEKEVMMLEEDDLTHLLTSARRIRQVPEELRPFLELLVEEAHEKCIRIQDIGLMKPKNVVSIAWSAALFGFRGSKFFGSSINQLVLQLPKTSVSDLATWCNACAKVKFTPPINPLDALNKHIITLARQLRPLDIERIMYFYAASGQDYFQLLHSGQSLLQCISQTATVKFNQFSLQQISSVMNSFPVLRFHPGSTLMGKAANLVNEVVQQGSEYQDSVLRVTFLLWAIGHFGFGDFTPDEDFYDRCLEFLIENGAKGLRPQDVVEFMLIFGWAGQLTPIRFKLFEEVLEKFQVGMFQPSSLADIFQCSLMVVVPTQDDNPLPEKVSALPAQFQQPCWEAWHNKPYQTPIQVQQISEHLTKMGVAHQAGVWCAGDLINVDILVPKQNLVIVFEDIDCYSCNVVQQAAPAVLGPTIGRRRMIRNLEYNVMAIPWFHWQQLFTSEDQIQYLSNVLKKSQTSGVGVLPNNLLSNIMGNTSSGSMSM
eukprot:TRINITY_DN2203_c0_g1_i1.p1 TRINITY_DN2203_c0_g1~~TRINITY_DN2203_c0_g1_i1.p1  ORF type:complete len:1190 (+),score=100.70 TRINITY_DN2203_c0_g1_i1:439-4008(+)